jgi:hypothetical protein
MKITLTELKAIIEEELESYLAEAKTGFVQKKPEAGKKTNKNAMGTDLEGTKINGKGEAAPKKLANVAKPNKEFGAGFSKAKGTQKTKGLADKAGTPGKEGDKAPKDLKAKPKAAVKK